MHYICTKKEKNEIKRKGSELYFPKDPKNNIYKANKTLFAFDAD